MVFRFDRWCRGLLFLTALATVGWVWSAVSHVDSTAGDVNSALTADRQVIDLGSVTSRTSDVRFRLTNRSDTGVRIQFLQASCGCMEPEIDRHRIPPGQSAVVSATMRHSRIGPGSEIPFSRRITVTYRSDDRIDELHLIARGRFLPPAWVEQPDAELKPVDDQDDRLAGDIPVFLRAEPRVSITAAHVFGREFDCAATVLDVSPESRDDTGEKWLRATVRVEGAVRKRPAAGLLTLTLDSEETPQIRVALRCPAADEPAARFSPRTIAFGILTPGETATQRGSVFWKQDAGYHVTGLKATPGFTVRAVNPQAHSPPHAIPIEVSTVPSSVVPGPLAGHVTVELTRGHEPPKSTELRIPVSGFVRPASQTLEGLP